MAYYNPKEIVEVLNQTAKTKNEFPYKKTLVLAFLGGAYIALGGLLALIVGGDMPGVAALNPGIQKFVIGAVFPLGLILVAIAGAELFTGNTAYFIPSVLSKRMSYKAPLRNWALVYTGNFVGAIFVAIFFAYFTDLLAHGASHDTMIALAVKKTSAPFYKVFLKGMACNWLVALGMWLAYSSKDIAGKIMGIWFPVMAFVAMGFEHSIANMFFIPTAIFYGADITWGEFIINNLIPATLGNIAGGGFLVGTLYWYAFEKE